jgi:uncharacterized membrane protein HdeD (DUF308 family)
MNLEKEKQLIEGILEIATGVIVAIYAWSKRPFEFRDTVDQISKFLLDDTNVLKKEYFYIAIVFSVAAIIYGFYRIFTNTPPKDSNQEQNL